MTWSLSPLFSTKRCKKSQRKSNLNQILKLSPSNSERSSRKSKTFFHILKASRPLPSSHKSNNLLNLTESNNIKLNKLSKLNNFNHSNNNPLLPHSINLINHTILTLNPNLFKDYEKALPKT